MSDRSKGFSVLLYHNAVPVVRAKARFSGPERMLLLLGPVTFPRNTRIEIEALDGTGLQSLAGRVAGRVAGTVVGFSRAGLQVDLLAFDAIRNDQPTAEGVLRAGS